MKLTFDSLRSHLSGEPARAYLVSGDEALLVGEAADAIRARVKKAGFDEREVHFIERVADWEEVRASSNNLSLFGARKLIELRLPSGKPGTGGAKAIVSSTKKVGGPGTRLDVPVTHIDASYVRSHFDAVEVGLADAPRADEMVLALVMTTGPRIHARVGGLQASEIKGEDGLR